MFFSGHAEGPGATLKSISVETRATLDQLKKEYKPPTDLTVCQFDCMSDVFSWTSLVSFYSCSKTAELFSKPEPRTASMRRFIPLDVSLLVLHPL